MRTLNVPLSALTPSLDLTLGEDAAKVGRTLAWSDVKTPWLMPYLEEKKLADAGPDMFRFRISLRKEGELVRARIRIFQTPELECARSLTLFRQTFETEQVAFFMREDDAEVRGERELSENEMEAYPLEGNRVELDALLLDALEMALPTVPLCRPDCLGLCAECGAGLNERGVCGRTQSKSVACPHFQSEPH